MKKVLIYSSLFSIAIILFQNCSNATLEKILPSTIYEAPKVDLKANLCGATSLESADNTKYIFVLDMSASNFGDWVSVNNGTSVYSVWHPELGSDINPVKNRFTAIEKFITDCVKSDSSSLNFKLIGFSEVAGQVTGAMGVTNTKILKCDGSNRAFRTKAQILSDISLMKEIQAKDSLVYQQWGNNTSNAAYPSYPNVSMIGTNYAEAFSCQYNVIFDDITLHPEEQDDYKILFLTDGKPSDNLGVCKKTASGPIKTDAQMEACLVKKTLESYQLTDQISSVLGRKISLTSVYYNPLSGSPVPPALINISNTVGGALKEIDGFSSDTSLCGLAEGKDSVGWRPESFGIMNLTLKRSNGKLTPDSDMDGVIDSEEINSSPTNPRSTGVPILDGICASLEAAGKSCRNEYDLLKSKCNANIFPSKYPISECDLKILGLDALATANHMDQGVDSDLDGIPDFIEIIKGTNPGSYDSNLDPDADHMRTIEEISLGRDPFISDAEIPTSLLNQFTTKNISVDSASCPFGGLQVSLDRMQVSKTRAFASTEPALSQFIHAEDEHVFYIYNNLSTVNLSAAMRDYKGYFIKVKYGMNNDGSEFTQPALPLVDPGLIYFMGGSVR